MQQRQEFERNNVRRDIETGGKIYLGQDDNVPDNVDLTQVVRLQTKEFPAGKTPNYGFFSYMSPSSLLNGLVCMMHEQGQNFEIDQKTWKVNMKVHKTIISDKTATSNSASGSNGSMSAGDQNGSSQGEQEQQGQLFTEYCEMQIEIRLVA